MGIVGLALGYTAKGMWMVDPEEVSHSHNIDVAVAPFNLPVRTSLLIKHKEQLDLDAVQVNYLKDREYVGWAHLNDSEDFSFDQFSTLINLVMEEINVAKVCG